MKVKRQCFSTMLSDLYGRDNYQSHIEEGREYWWCWPANTDVYEKTGENWHKLKVTYIRSGCMFYVLTDAPEMGELFCPINSILASTLIFAEIDPIKDLNLNNVTAAKLKYCFNDERTLIKNWDNDRIIEIDENQLNSIDAFDYLVLKSLEIK